MATEADEFNKAFSSGSADLTRMYAEDGIAFPPDRELAKGQGSIERLWKEVQRDWSDAKLKQIERFQTGEYLFETGSWTAKFQGQPVQGKYMTLWKKEGGSYKIYRDMWNRDTEL